MLGRKLALLDSLGVAAMPFIANIMRVFLLSLEAEQQEKEMFKGKSRDELLFFAQNGYWPTDVVQCGKPGTA